jgi:hypothetical protein
MSRNSILESLSQNRINESSDLVEGDRIKVMKDFTFPQENPSKAGDVLVVHILPNRNPMGRYIFSKLDKKGKEISGSKGTLGIHPRNLEIYISNGTVKVLSANDPLTLGEVTIDTLKSMLFDIGIDTLSGIPINKLVVGDGKFFRIELGKLGEKNNTELILDRIEDILKKNNIKVDSRETFPTYCFYIRKVQG